MKIITDEMPEVQNDCPFLSFGKFCQINGYSKLCVYFELPEDERCREHCSLFKALGETKQLLLQQGKENQS